MQYIGEPTKIHGHTFRIIDPSTITVERGSVLQNIREDDKLFAFTRERFEQFMYFILEQSHRQVKDDQAMTNIHLATANMKNVSQNRVNYDPIIDMACYVIMIDDEPDDIVADYITKKKNLCKDFPEVAFFFISAIELFANVKEAFSITSSLSDYLQETQSQKKEALLTFSMDVNSGKTTTESETNPSTPEA